jgi:hypothetical protein
LALLLVTGCAYAPLRASPTAAEPLPAGVASYYDYPRTSPQATVTPVRERAAFRELLITFPLAASGFEPTEPVVELEWFESKEPGRRPAILLNPILGGDYPLERGICRYFASHGFHVAMVHRKTLKISPEHDVSRIELLLRQGIIRIRQVVDWMASHERVDAQRLGSFGISMGGIAGVIAAAVEPRLRVHVIALAGGSIPDILAGSSDSLLAKPRARYLAHQRIDLRTLEERLREAIRTDPIRLAPYVDPGKVLMFIALADRTIGTPNALRLRRALRYPETNFLPLGHYTSYFLLPYLKYQSLRYFKETLGP